MHIYWNLSGFIPGRFIDDMSALVQKMAWCQSCNKPLPEWMMTKTFDVIQLQFDKIEHYDYTRWTMICRVMNHILNDFYWETK